MEDDNFFEEGPINFTDLPTLKHITTVKIVTLLFTQDDVIEEMKQYFQQTPSYYEMTDKRKSSFNKVLNKIASLHFPNLLREEVSNAVRPIGQQLFQYVERHIECVQSLHLIFWTNEGKIEKGKTFCNANFKMDILSFAILSSYCLRDEFLNIWDEKFYEMEESILDGNLNYEDHLSAYWICYAKKELHKFLSFIIPNDPQGIYDAHHSVPKNMFSLATFCGNVHAAKYFWPQMTLQERDDIRSHRVTIIERILEAMNVTEEEEVGDTLFFLLSKLNGKEQREILEIYGGKIITALLNYWPWKRYFSPAVSFMWDFLKGEDYVDLLDKVSKLTFFDKAAGILFAELFHSAPKNLKSFYIRFLIEDSKRFEPPTAVFWTLIDAGCFESVQAILRCGNHEERKQMMFLSVEDFGFETILRNNIFLLDKLIDEFLSSESEIKDFKLKIIRRWSNTLFKKWLMGGNFQTADLFLEWVFTSENEISNYKKETLDKIVIIQEMIRNDKMSLMYEFVSWCFSSDLEIDHFKRELFVTNFQIFIIDFSKTDWDTFQQFVKWCVVPEEKIMKLRERVSNFDVMKPLIFNIICNFDYAEKLLVWCFHSKEKIIEFKRTLITSQEGFDILADISGMIGNIFKPDNIEKNEVKPKITKLAKFYYPLEKDVLEEVKSKGCSLWFHRENLNTFLSLLDQFAVIGDLDGSQFDSV